MSLLINGKSKANLLACLLFFLILISPLCNLFFPSFELDVPISEKRKLAKPPNYNDIGINDYLLQLTKYVDDNFAFRTFLISLHNQLHYHFLGTSGSPLVVVGKEGWMFYTGKGGTGVSTENYFGRLPFDHKPLFRQIRMELEAKKAFLKLRNIIYLLVIAPDKWSIYPEYLPVGYNSVRGGSLVDQLLKYLENESSIEILDLRRPLREAKAGEHRLYFKYDGHWNNYGAFLGYRAISDLLAEKFPTVHPHKLSDFTLEKKNKSGGDLSLMLGVAGLHDDHEFSFTPKKPYIYRLAKKGKGQKPSLRYENEKRNLPRGLMFRDSFSAPLIPFLSNDFSSIVYMSDYWGQQFNIAEAIELVRPHIVIEQIIERNLISPYR